MRPFSNFVLATSLLHDEPARTERMDVLRCALDLLATHLKIPE